MLKVQIIIRGVVTRLYLILGVHCGVGLNQQAHNFIMAPFSSNKQWRAAALQAQSEKEAEGWVSSGSAGTVSSRPARKN